jgi:hypothetical protein
MAEPKGIRSLAVTYLILGVLSLPLALIGAVSGSYNIKGPFDAFMDILMRILFIGAPIGLLVSATGLFGLKKWGMICAVIVSAIFSITCLIYGIIGLGYKGNTVFCGVCFFLTALFVMAIISLFKNKEQFS